ncbi:uncharacterized protein [Macrobrachium rosenbergii]|uniref:uncharacterized protein isoform X10 n=1 Tax=Macrobrachium rosenbergii TaxID=79674 RepID=UPI0034D5C528
MESASSLVKGVPPIPHFHSEKSPLPKDFPVSLQVCSSPQRDARSYSPDSQTSDIQSSNSSRSLDGSPTEVKEDPFFEGQRPARGPRALHNGPHESLMTDSGIYDNDVLESDSSDSMETGEEDRPGETRPKVIDKPNGIEEAGGREGRHAFASSEGALEKYASESGFYAEIADTSSPVKLKDESEPSQQRPNSVDLSWYDSVSSDFYINSAFEGNVSGIAEFDPAKQGHYLPDPEPTGSDLKSSKSTGKRMVMLIEEPKRRENTDASYNTDEDELAAYIYDPQINDSYNTCLMKNREFLEDPYIELHRKIQKDREREGDILEDSLEDPLEDPNFALPSSPSPLPIPPDYEEEEDEFFMQVVPPFGDVTSKPHGFIDYKFEMHDATWGVSSGEVYFDLLTGQRILSTIYEFEVSSDEDTDSYRMTDSRLSDVEEEEIRSFRKDSLEEEEEEEEWEEEDPDLFSRDTLSAGEGEEKDGGHTSHSQPVCTNVGDERDLLKRANESEKPSLSADRERGESIPRDTSVSDACTNDDSPLNEETLSHLSDKMEREGCDVGGKNSSESVSNSDLKAACDKDEDKFEHSGLHCVEDENETGALVMQEDEMNRELKDKSGIHNGDEECELVKNAKTAPQNLNESADEDAHDISIVVTTADENCNGDEDFFASNTFMTTRDHYQCNDSSACVAGSDDCCGSANHAGSCRNTLEVTGTVNTHLSDDEAFQSDAETDVTYVSNHETDVHVTNNGHHDVANIAEADFSDSDEEKNAHRQKSRPSKGRNKEKVNLRKKGDNVDEGTVMSDNAQAASSSVGKFDPDHTGSGDSNRVPNKDCGPDDKSKSERCFAEGGNAEASITDPSNTEAEAVSCHETEALAASSNLKKSEMVDASCIEADALLDRDDICKLRDEEINENNNVNNDQNYCCKEGGVVLSAKDIPEAKFCENCEKENKQVSLNDEPNEGQTSANNCTEINKIGNSAVAEEGHLSIGKTECDSSWPAASIAKEKQPVIDSIQYTEEVAEDLHLPPGRVSRVVCVCCDNLIGQDILSRDSGPPFKDGETEESDESESNLRRASSNRESTALRTAASVAAECEGLVLNIGHKQKCQERNVGENCRKSFDKDRYLTGEEFEICVPDLPPAKPKRLFLRRLSSELKTPGSTPPVPLFDNTGGHPEDPDLAQPPVKPKRRRHSPMSPPRKMKRLHRNQMSAVEGEVENGEAIEREIERMSREEYTGENTAVVGSVDVPGGGVASSYSGSSSLGAETAGEARGKRVGTGPDPRDPGSHQLDLNTNSSSDEEIRSSPDAHETLVSQSRGERATNDQGEGYAEEKRADRVFPRPTKVTEVVASLDIDTKQHLDSPPVLHKLPECTQSEIECIRDEERADTLNNNDVCYVHGYAPGEAVDGGAGFPDKPVTKSSEEEQKEEEERHETKVADNSNVLRDITNELETNVGHSNVGDVNAEHLSTGNGTENKEVSCPRPPRRKKRSHSFNTIKDSQRIHFITNVPPQEEVRDPRTPPKVPPRTYGRFQSLPRRPKTQEGVPSSGRHSAAGGAGKAVGRSASTATCRPHSIRNRESVANDHLAQVPSKSPKLAAAAATQGTPTNTVKLVSFHPLTHSFGPATSTEVSKNKRLSDSFRKKGSYVKKHYLSLPRNLARKFATNSSGNTDDPVTTCFPYLFSRKQKDLYDFSFPSSHPSEIPEPEPYARAPSTGSVESFSNLFTFYSSMEHYEHDHRIENPFTKDAVPSHTQIPQGQVDKIPPQAPPRRNRKESPGVLRSRNTFSETEQSSESIAQSHNAVNSNESESMSQDLNRPSNSPNDENKETPLHLKDTKEKELILGDDNTKLPAESSCAAEMLSPNESNDPSDVSKTPQATEKSVREIYDHREVEEEEEEEKQPSLNTAENREGLIHNDETVEGHSAPSISRQSGDSVTDEEPHSLQEGETTLTTADPEGVATPTATPTDVSATPEVLQQKQVPWTPPNVALQTWAERQGVQELEFTPLSLRRLTLEKRKDYGSLKERRIKTYLSMGQIDWKKGFSQRERDWKGYQSLEDLGGKIYGSMDDIRQDTPSPGPPVDHEKEENQQDSNNKSQKRGEDDTRVQQDRCVEVYPETVRQRQRNMMTSANKVDIKNWTSSGNDTLTSPSKVKKFLPSVKALRNQFETGKTNNNRAETNGNGTTNGNLSRKSSISNSSVASSIEKTSSTNSLNSANGSVENLHSSNIENSRPVDPDEPVEPIYSQFKKVDEELRELMSKPPSTTGWNPRPLLKRLYYVPDAPKHHSQGTTYINIEGYLEKLPSGRKKATFWNAWKRRYFVAKDGVLYYYQNPQADKASMKMTLMGGKVECMEPSMVGVDDGSRDSKAGAMIGIDDGKGHYVVVRCSSKQEAERWRRALETHTVEDFASQYVQPWPIPTNPTMLRDTLIIDLGSCSVRAGVLASQATLPQVFFPSVVATERESRRQIWGFDALSPDVRSVSSVSFPVRPSHKISKYSVDLSAVSSLLQKAFADLKVDPKNYNIQLSVPRVLNPNTQAELLRLLFDKYGVKSVNLTHQSILALYAYNATSGIVVDIGDRLDIVPVIDGYIVDGGVSRVPYGGYRILDHLRQFLYMRNVSLINEVESYIIRQVLENICYCAHHYNTEKARCTNNPDNYEKGVSLAEYFQKDCPYEFISLDFGRFQATEGLFNPDAWGLDHPGIHKLVHKAIMECSMDIRKEMSRSIFLAGGVTQLPGLVERLTTEIDNLTPPAIRPKVHASPYRYHAAYIGACVLAESPAFTQSKITREDWNKHGNAALKKWSL